MKDDDNQDNRVLNYYTKVSFIIGIAIVILSIVIYFVGDRINIGWIFIPVWVIAVILILRGFYLKWFK